MILTITTLESDIVELLIANDSSAEFFSADNFLLNNVANVANVATLNLSQAINAKAETMESAKSLVDGVLDTCKDNPGQLFSPEFTDALKNIRQDPMLWAEYRVKLKKAKPSGVLLADIDEATAPPSEGGGDGSIAAELIALVSGQGELFFDVKADKSFMSVDVGGVNHTYAIGGKAFIEWLSFSYYQATRSEEGPGKSASETAIKQAGFALAGIAKHDGHQQRVYIRVADHNGGHYVFIGDEQRRVIEILPTGWRIISQSPVKFWQPSSMQSLPLPQPGGNLSDLWKFVNIPEKERPLILAWLLEAMRSETPKPIAAISGPQGTAKSATHDKLRQLIDNNTANLRPMPKSVEDIFVSAGCNWFSSFENISHLTPLMQDALCTLATGGGFATRTFYTNSEETIIDVRNPVIINSIPNVVTAQDLTDRAISIELAAIETYKEEAEMKTEWEQAKHAIFGGLLDLFVKTLAQLPRVRIINPPRMADFTRLGEAMMQAQGERAGTFDTLYKENRAESVSRALESSPVAVAVCEMVEKHKAISETVFLGTVKDLLDRLSKEHRHDSEGWPRSAKGLSGALKRQIPALATLGIIVELGRKVERINESRGIPITIKKSGNVVNVGNMESKKSAAENNFNAVEDF